MANYKKVPTSVSLDPFLLDSLRKRSVVTGFSISKIVAEALEKYLEENKVEV